MKSLFHKQFIILSIAGIAFLGSLIALYLFASTMKAKEVRVIEARDRLASFEQNKRTFTEEAKELEAIKGRIEALETNLLSQASIPPLLSSIESLAAARNVSFSLTSVQYTPETPMTQPSLAIDFSAEGSSAGLEGLAKDMLAQSYQAHFSRLSLFQANEGWQLLARIDITSF